TVLLRLLFFQAEDGIRVDLVTGVQTCALPIYAVGVPEVLGWDDATLVVSQVPPGRADAAAAERLGRELARLHGAGASRFGAPWRSEERRVGKEWEARGAAERGTGVEWCWRRVQ